MKLLLIGGTGIISTACVRLAAQRGLDVFVLNRGLTKNPLPEGVTVLRADVHDESAVASALGDHQFDVIANFMAFTTEDVERDIRMFRNRTRQYIFISSASAYQAPPVNYRISE